MPDSVVIVGASLAGVRCAGALRREGFHGAITMVDGEGRSPYDRPPLSKQFLRGEWDEERIRLVPEDQLRELELTWVTGTATGLDVGRRAVQVGDSELAGDAVVISTGASPRRLPGVPHAAGVHLLRSVDDSIRLRNDLADDEKSVVVVGAGFIGSEVAAVAADQGHLVTILEAGPAPMQRGLGERIGLLCGSLHAEHGVELRLATSVAEVLTDDGARGPELRGVRLSTGEMVPADILVIGIGVVPNVGWLEDSGLHLDDGVVCDSNCAAAPDIYAAGDVARWYNQRFDEIMRVEHWDNAVEQGTYVAKRILGEQEPYSPVPWFWSDQYEHKIQLAGRPHHDDKVEIVAGSPDENRFVAIYGRGDRLTGVFGLNRPRQVMIYRRLIAEGATWQDALDHAMRKET